MILKNLRILTMDAFGDIERGYVGFEGGKITLLGDGEPSFADEAEYGNVLSCDGLTLVPGFIDAHTHLGIVEDSLDFEGDDCNEESSPSTPELRALDAINPLDRCFTEAREGGVTSVAVAPGSANPIGGQICVVKTVGKRIDSMVVRTPAAIKFALGENPKSTYHAKNSAPNTRMATAAIMRESLFKAKKYLEALERSREDEELDEPDFDFECEALIPLLKREIPAHFHAHRADDIFTAIRVAEEFNLDYRIVHCTEGYLIADELSSLGTRAIVGPTLTDRSKPELKGQSRENPAALEAAGVSFALTTDHPVTPVQYLPLAASVAVKNGLSEARALEAITSEPAKILGIFDRVGSISPGKDADFVLIDGEPLTGRIVRVFIDGNQVFGD